LFAPSSFLLLFFLFFWSEPSERRELIRVLLSSHLRANCGGAVCSLNLVKLVAHSRQRGRRRISSQATDSDLVVIASDWLCFLMDSG
jgi:hypothetical protein